MASTFKNAGLVVGTTDNSSADLYTAPGAGTAVIHALYVSNKNANNTAEVDIKVTIDGGTTFIFLGKSIEIQPENTLIFDKPINEHKFVGMFSQKSVQLEPSLDVISFPLR